MSDPRHGRPTVPRFGPFLAQPDFLAGIQLLAFFAEGLPSPVKPPGFKAINYLFAASF
jgi:hypothetical protein